MYVFSITLGHLSLLVERYAAPAQQLFSSPRPGEVIIDLPMFRIYLENHRRLAARPVATVAD